MANRNSVKRIYASATVYESHGGRDNLDTRSILIDVVYAGSRPEKIDVCACDCSEACMEHYGEWDLESFIHIRGEAAQKLADKFSAHDAKILLDRMSQRFRPYGWEAFREIERWLTKKGIAYSNS